MDGERQVNSFRSGSGWPSSVAAGEGEVFVVWASNGSGGTDTSTHSVLGRRVPNLGCEDGLKNQGEERIDCGGPCAPCECLADGPCSDDMFCNGTESCDGFGQCQSAEPVVCDDGVGCTEDSCNESTDSCDYLTNDSLCDNGLFCDGDETCDATLDCQAGAAPCPDPFCDEPIDSCSGFIFADGFEEGLDAWDDVVGDTG